MPLQYMKAYVKLKSDAAAAEAIVDAFRAGVRQHCRGNELAAWVVSEPTAFRLFFPRSGRRHERNGVVFQPLELPKGQYHGQNSHDDCTTDWIIGVPRP
jgi:hypothetical protein